MNYCRQRLTLINNNLNIPAVIVSTNEQIFTTVYGWHEYEEIDTNDPYTIKILTDGREIYLQSIDLEFKEVSANIRSLKELKDCNDGSLSALIRKMEKNKHLWTLEINKDQYPFATPKKVLMIDNVDLKQLEKQRLSLAKYLIKTTMTEADSEPLSGLLNMLDGWSDTLYHLEN